MASVFSTDVAGGVFGATAPCGGGSEYVLSHARAAHLVYGVAPRQDARGEIALSYVGIGSIAMEMQPEERAVLREMHGIVIQVGWRGIAPRDADLRELDRVIFLGQRLEIVQVSPWPDHLEIEYRQIGR